jgi:hypothetical protein
MVYPPTPGVAIAPCKASGVRINPLLLGFSLPKTPTSFSLAGLLSLTNPVIGSEILSTIATTLLLLSVPHRDSFQNPTILFFVRR